MRALCYKLCLLLPLLSGCANAAAPVDRERQFDTPGWKLWPSSDDAAAAEFLAPGGVSGSIASPSSMSMLEKSDSAELQRQEQGVTVYTSFASALLQMISESRVLQLNIALVIGLIVFVVAFELIHLRYSGVDFDQRFLAYERRELEHNQGQTSAICCAFDLWMGYIQAHYGHFFVTIALVGLMITAMQYIQYLMLLWYNDFWGRVQKWGSGKASDEQVGIFFAMLALWLLYAMAHVLANAYLGYMLSMFRVHIWGALTKRFADRWLEGFAFYRMELDTATDNPDQRIAEDTSMFIFGSTSLATGLVQSISTGVIFSVEVCKLSPERVPFIGIRLPGWLLYASLLYAVFVTGILHLLAWRIKILDATQQGVEADLRYELISVRHFAETIALNRSARYHFTRIMSTFENVRRCVWENMFVNKRFGIASRFLDETEILWVFIFLGPSFLNGEITLGHLMAANRAFQLMKSAALWFAHSYGLIQAWLASTERLAHFEEAVARHDEASRLQIREDAERLTMHNLRVWVPSANGPQDIFIPPTPTAHEKDSVKEAQPLEREINASAAQRTLLQCFSLDEPSGLRMLLKGPSGTGKSTLLRALSGAWPSAEGLVAIPGKLSNALFFPERVCVPEGTLKAAVTYPSMPDKIGENEVLHALELVGLAELAEKGVEKEAQWNSVLSAGQKARLNLARLALHRPFFSALDEPTAHLEVSVRAETLRKVFSVLPASCSIIVVSHDEDLEASDLFNKRFAFDCKAQTLTPM